MDRNEVQNAAKSDPERALRLARGVQDPWHRTQALAWAARFGPTARAETVALESIRAAAECSEPYQRLGALAWPIRMLVETGMATRACALVQEALRRLPDVEPPSSRSEAAFLLFQAAFHASDESREQLARAVAAVAASDTHWRTHRNAVDALWMLHAVDRALAASVAAAIPSEKLQARIARQTARQTILEPRPFFW